MAPLDTILNQLTPVGNTLIIWFGAFAKHKRQDTVTFTSERLNVRRHAALPIPQETSFISYIFICTDLA